MHTPRSPQKPYPGAQWPPPGVSAGLTFGVSPVLLCVMGVTLMRVEDWYSPINAILLVGGIFTNLVAFAFGLVGIGSPGKLSFPLLSLLACIGTGFLYYFALFA